MTGINASFVPGTLKAQANTDWIDLAYGCKLQILVSLICVWDGKALFVRPFRYRLGLSVKKFTKNAVISVLI